MRRRYLKERELHLTELCTDLDRVRPLADSDVLHKVPDVVVFERGPPLRAAEPCVTAGNDVGKAAVGSIGVRRIISADAKLREQVHIGIGPDARCHQSRETRAGFGNQRGGPDARVADLPVPVEVEFAGAVEAAVIEGSRKRRYAVFARVSPTDGAEQAVLVA